MAAFSLNNLRDEPSWYENGRYICSSQAVWRTLGLPIHEHFPPVQQLQVHLENGQRVLFDPSIPNSVFNKVFLHYFMMSVRFHEYNSIVPFQDIQASWFTYSHANYCFYSISNSLLTAR